MSNKDTPLTERQAAILDVISDGGAYTNVLLAAKMGFQKNGQDLNKLSWNIDRLKARQMIDTWVTGKTRAYSINQFGRAALRERQAHIRLYGNDAAPPASRGLLMDRPVYVPPAAVYYRNAGHTHIPSRGIGA